MHDTQKRFHAQADGLRDDLSIIHYVRFTRDGSGHQPKQAYRDDAGWDLAIASDETLRPGERRDLRTGIKAAFPDGTWGMIVPRSSIVRRFPVQITTGVIDCGFRGELQILVTNIGLQTVEFKAGDRLAQVILIPMVRVEWVEQSVLPPGTRELRGFGSSGLGPLRHVGSEPAADIEPVLNKEEK